MVTGALCLSHDNLWSFVPGWLAMVLPVFTASLAFWAGRSGNAHIQCEVLFDGHLGWQQSSSSEQLADSVRWFISPASRATPVGLVLHFEQPSGQTMVRWLFRSECTIADYRRLARALRQ